MSPFLLSTPLLSRAVRMYSTLRMWAVRIVVSIPIMRAAYSTRRCWSGER